MSQDKIIPRWLFNQRSRLNFRDEPIIHLLEPLQERLPRYTRQEMVSFRENSFHRLKTISNQFEKELLTYFPMEKVKELMRKIHHTVDEYMENEIQKVKNLKRIQARKYYLEEMYDDFLSKGPSSHSLFDEDNLLGSKRNITIKDIRGNKIRIDIDLSDDYFSIIQKYASKSNTDPLHIKLLYKGKVIKPSSMNLYEIGRDEFLVACIKK